MIATTPATTVLARTFRVLIVLETLPFVCFALLHLGVRIPLGFAVLQEPQRPYAVIVEGVAAILLALAMTASSREEPGRGRRQPGRRPSPWRACCGA